MSSKKPKVLTLNEKAAILDSLEKGESVTSLSKKYSVAKSTICGIRKKKDLILKCVGNAYSGSEKKKTLRLSKLPKMEKRLNRWFIQMRNKNLTVSGIMLKEKAKELHSKIKEKHESVFLASNGWLNGFKKRYGIRILKIPEEKHSSQPELVEPFKENWNSELNPLIKSTTLLQNLDPHIVYPLPVIEEWNEDHFEYGPSENNELVKKEYDDDYTYNGEREDFRKISASDAVEIFDKALEWCVNEGVHQSDINVLRRIRENAVDKALGRIQQKKITDFFYK